MEKLLEEIIKTENGWILLLLLSPGLGLGVCIFLIVKYNWIGSYARLVPPKNQVTVKEIMETVNGGSEISRKEFDSAQQGFNATMSGMRSEMRAMTAAIAELELKLSERIARLEERKK